MPDTTTILSLPLILPAQAQKHVTHNEALVALDLAVQLTVINRTLTTPPSLPALGDRHIVATGATGAWAGQAGRIALFLETGWQFTQALPGWQAHVRAEGQTAVFDGVAWKTLSDQPLNVPQLGVAATADAVNRLTVAAPATLLTHAGAGHQLKLNKATAADTASLLFQTGFSGRAEIGTAGSDGFAIKVSADGAAWSTALAAAPATGEVTLAAPVRLGGQAADPGGPVNGTLWLNTTTGEVRVRSGGVTLPVGGGISDGDKGDVTVSGGGAVWTVDPGAITLAKLASVPTASFLGRETAGTGVPETLTATQARTILNVASGATANASDAALRDRATHTGTQPASTITGLAAVATSGSASDLGAGTLPAARFNDAAHGNRAGGTLHPDATTTVSGFMSGADKTKLNGVATGATANSADATLLARANHTGTQPAGTITGLAAVATSGSASDLGAGTLPAARLPALSGDVTSTAGTAATSLTNDAVTNAKLANMAAATLKGRTTAGIGDPEDLTGTQATALLDTVTSVAKGLAPASGGGTTNFLRADGTWAVPAGGGGLGDGDKGDITVSGSGAVWTIDPATVTLAKMADIATARIFGRVTAATGVPEALTGTQATTLLDAFTASLKGLVPPSGGGTSTFLRADGIFAAPPSAPGIITGVPSGNQADFNPAGFGSTIGTIKLQPTTGSVITGLAAGATDQVVTLINDSTQIVCLAKENTASSAVNRFDEHMVPSFWLLPQESVTLRYSATLSRWVRISASRDVFAVGARGQLFLPQTTTGVNTLGFGSVTTTATISTVGPLGTPTTPLAEYSLFQVTNSTAAGTSSARTLGLSALRGATAGRQGFFHSGAGRFTALGATGAVRAGMTNSNAAITTLNAATVQCLLVGADTTDTTLRVYSGDAAAGTPVNLGANFPAPSATAEYEWAFLALPNTASVRYLVRRLDSHFVAEGTLTANLPGNTQALGQRIESMVGATAAANTAQAAYLLTAGL